jgi:hypothetical protein
VPCMVNSISLPGASICIAKVGYYMGMIYSPMGPPDTPSSENTYMSVVSKAYAFTTNMVFSRASVIP